MTGAKHPDPAVTVTGTFTVAEKDLDAVLAHLEEHILLTRAETGCQVFTVTQSQDNPCRFDVYEVFDSAQSFAEHQQRVKSSVWWQVTQNAERHYDFTTG